MGGVGGRFLYHLPISLSSLNQANFDEENLATKPVTPLSKNNKKTLTPPLASTLN